MIADKIQVLRESKKLSQAELAEQLGLTRSAINAWEMGVACPSTPYIVSLAKLFNVSCDYLLDMDSTSTIDISGLTDDDIEIVYNLISHLRNKNS